MESHLIFIMVMAPLLGAGAQVFFPDGRGVLYRWLALSFSFLPVLISLAFVVLLQGGGGGQGFQTETVSWLEPYSIQFGLRIDGLNLPVVLLVSLLAPFLITLEWDLARFGRGFFGALLFFQTALLMSLLSQDLFLENLFWALSVFVAYFVFAIWGEERKDKNPPLRFLVFSSISIGTVFFALVLIYFGSELHTFDLLKLKQAGISGWGNKSINLFGASFGVRGLAFFAFCLAGLFRVPVWPLNGWLSQTARQLSGRKFIIFSAGLSLVGTFLFGRTATVLFSDLMVEAATAVSTVGAISLVGGALGCVFLKELRELCASATTAMVGLVLIGFASGTTGGVAGSTIHLLISGIALSALGPIFESLKINERVGSSDSVGRLSGNFVLYSATFLAVAMATLAAIPGFAGFASYSMIFFGSFGGAPWVAVVGVLGTLILVGGLFSRFQNIFLTESQSGGQLVVRLQFREVIAIGALLFFSLCFGLFPKPLVSLFKLDDPSALTQKVGQ